MLSITPMNDNSSTRSGKFDLARALNAVRALIDNPDDTAQAFRVVDALAGGTSERNMRRFRATEVGRRVLGERRSLLAALSDRKRLEALDEGTVGHAYLRFMQEEGITADGLVEAQRACKPGRCNLADAVANDGDRRRAPAAPQLGAR